MKKRKPEIENIEKFTRFQMTDSVKKFFEVAQENGESELRQGLKVDRHLATLCFVPAGKIHLGKQIRTKVDPDGLQELAESIEQQGILHPPVVIEREDGNYELAAGLRRFLAMRDVLKRSTIPVIVLPPDRAKDKQAIQLIENVYRKDLHPVEMARAVGELFMELWERYGQILPPRGGKAENMEKGIEKQGDTTDQDHLQFLVKTEYLRKVKRLDDAGLKIYSELRKMTGMAGTTLGILLYLFVQGPEVLAKLEGLNFSLKHCRVLMDNGFYGKDVVRWLEEVDRKGLTASELASRIAIEKARAEQASKSRVQKLLQRVYNFGTTIKRNKTIRESPEIRQKVKQYLVELVRELERLDETTS